MSALPLVFFRFYPGSFASSMIGAITNAAKHWITFKSIPKRSLSFRALIFAPKIIVNRELKMSGSIRSPSF
jgi:hypothetical protein